MRRPPHLREDRVGFVPIFFSSDLAWRQVGLRKEHTSLIRKILSKTSLSFYFRDARTSINNLQSGSTEDQFIQQSLQNR